MNSELSLEYKYLTSIIFSLCFILAIILLLMYVGNKKLSNKGYITKVVCRYISIRRVAKRYIYTVRNTSICYKECL